MAGHRDGPDGGHARGKGQCEVLDDPREVHGAPLPRQPRGHYGGIFTTPAPTSFLYALCALWGGGDRPVVVVQGCPAGTRSLWPVHSFHEGSRAAGMRRRHDSTGGMPRNGNGNNDDNPNQRCASWSASGGGWGGSERKRKFVYVKWASHVWLSIQHFIVPLRKLFWFLVWVGGPAKPPPPPPPRPLWISTSLILTVTAHNRRRPVVKRRQLTVDRWRWPVTDSRS